MKYTFRVKIVAMLFAAILATISLCFLFNSTLLVRYYEYQKTETLGEVFDELNKVFRTKETVSVSQEMENNKTAGELSKEDAASVQDGKNQESEIEK